jgi:hypothetical protein
MAAQVPLAKKIHIRFKRFRRDLTDVWEYYVLLNHVLDKYHTDIKNGTSGKVLLQSVFQDSTKQLAATDLYTITQKTRQSFIPKNTLIEAVAIFEDYFQDLTYMVYMEKPELLLSADKASIESQNAKLLELIVKEHSRREILDQVAEEKIRGIFYGNPTDILKKDKVHLGLEKKFGEGKANELLQLYAEIIGRRNIHTHNAGRVDRKYIKENPTTPFKIGSSVQLPYGYLRSSLRILQVIAAHATESVVFDFW